MSRAHVPRGSRHLWTIGSALLAIIAILAGAGAVFLVVTFGLTGVLRTPVDVIDAGECSAVVIDLASVDISMPAGPVAELASMRGGRTTVTLRTSGRVASLASPTTELLGVDYCRARVESGEWSLQTIASRGDTWEAPGQKFEPVAAGTYVFAPEELEDTTLVIDGDPVGRVTLDGQVRISGTASLVFALGASALAALAGAILCFVSGRRSSRRRDGRTG